jgi:hypothetical protein
LPKPLPRTIIAAHQGEFLTKSGIWLVGLLLAVPAQANTIDCGGDAFSYGVLVRSKGRGVIRVAPTTLCADLSDDRGSDRGLDVEVVIQGGPARDLPEAVPDRPTR